jgi:hypothetical protein
LYTNLTVAPRSLKGKWYFPSSLDIPKRVKSSNWKICVEWGAKVTISLWQCSEDPSHHLSGDLNNDPSITWYPLVQSPSRHGFLLREVWMLIWYIR